MSKVKWHQEEKTNHSFFSFNLVTFYAQQVKHLNFYDIVLDFILMDSFEDLENPPISIQNVINNRWLNSSFKETVSETAKSKKLNEICQSIEGL